MYAFMCLYIVLNLVILFSGNYWEWSETLYPWLVAYFPTWCKLFARYVKLSWVFETWLFFYGCFDRYLNLQFKYRSLWNFRLLTGIWGSLLYKSVCRARFGVKNSDLASLHSGHHHTCSAACCSLHSACRYHKWMVDFLMLMVNW